MMQNTINYKFGDVVLVPFPFTDQTTTKKRPAIVVSSPNYHLHRLDLILIDALVKPSIIKPVLTTLDVKLVIKKLGQIEEPDYQALQNLLKTILG